MIPKENLKTNLICCLKKIENSINRIYGVNCTFLSVLIPGEKPEDIGGVKAMVLKQMKNFVLQQPKKGVPVRPLPTQVSVPTMCSSCKYFVHFSNIVITCLSRFIIHIKSFLYIIDIVFKE